jgi:hypothetical protein
MRWLLFLLVAVSSSCDVYDKPMRPVGDALQSRTLEGELIDASVLRGSPWVVAVWVPG